MRQINIRTLRNKLSTQLEDLPVEITKNGHIIAVLCTHGDYNDEVEIKPKKSTILNDNIKTTSYTDGRLSFNPQPKFLIKR